MWDSTKNKVTLIVISFFLIQVDHCILVLILLLPSLQELDFPTVLRQHFYTDSLFPPSFHPNPSSAPAFVKHQFQGQSSLDCLSPFLLLVIVLFIANWLAGLVIFIHLSCSPPHPFPFPQPSREALHQQELRMLRAALCWIHQKRIFTKIIVQLANNFQLFSITHS